MTTPCATLVASGHTGSYADSGYCYDGTWWYDTKSDFSRIRRWDFPAMSASHDVYVGASGDAEYPAIDFAGFLYCIDYRGSADVVVKVDLSTGPSFTHTDLASFTPANKTYGLVYHPTTGLLYAIKSTLSGGTRTQIIYSINPSSGATTALLTHTSSTTGDHELFEFKPTAITADALWGLGNKKPTPHAIWRFDLAGVSLAFGLDGGEIPAGPGIGTKLNTLLVHDNSPSGHDVEVDSSLAEVAWSCSTVLGDTVGAQHSSWNFVAVQLSTNIYEIAAPTPPPASAMTNWSITAPGWYPQPPPVV